MHIGNVWRQVKTWLDLRVSIDAVSRLDDRLLQDMGIPRDRIAETVTHGKAAGALPEHQVLRQWFRPVASDCNTHVAKAAPACAAP